MMIPIALAQLNYHTPSPQPRRRWPFWCAFIGAWIAGLPIAYVLDNAIKWRLSGGPADGGVTFLAALVGVPAALLAGFLQDKSPVIAAVIAVPSAPIAVVLMYALWR